MLLEDVPGVAKTMLARAFARSVGCTFQRIQCTPDLLPTDVTGGSIFNQKTSEFEFRPGPIFAQVVLADEINRATPRTQAALLEAMAEGSVTIDGVTHRLKPPFLVIAHAEPDRSRGDVPAARGPARPVPDEAVARLSDARRRIADARHAQARASAGKTAAGDFGRRAGGVPAGRARRCTLIRKFGITSRRSFTPPASITTCGWAAVRGRRSHCTGRRRRWPAIRGRNYVEPDDVKNILPPVLTHRMILRPEARLQNVTAEELVAEILESTPVPVMKRRTRPSTPPRHQKDSR